MNELLRKEVEEAAELLVSYFFSNEICSPLSGPAMTMISSEKLDHKKPGVTLQNEKDTLAKHTRQFLQEW